MVSQPWREADLSAGIIAGFMAAELPDPWRWVAFLVLIVLAWLTWPVLNYRAGRAREARARHYRTGEDHGAEDDPDPDQRG